MEIDRIFAVTEEEQLFSIKWKGQEEDEFHRMLNFLTAADQLYGFFDQNQEDFTDPFFDGISIEEAVRQTRDEALNLQQDLLDMDESTNKDFSSLFEPLSPSEYDPENYNRNKAKGQLAKST